ncbi:MAG: translation initiation factor eIF-1A [archaeon]|nr:translation initiation factor eIF-1A [archaeon]
MAFHKRNPRDSEESGEPGSQGFSRIVLPRGREVIGIIAQRVGGSRMLISCMDGKTRNCRVPGRLKRSLWLREGDVVIVEPWEFDNDKGDVLYKYTKSAIERLKRDGLLKTSSSEF